MRDDPRDENAADLLGLALAGRPDRVADAFRATQPAEVRAELAQVTEALATLGREAAPIAPSPALRDRLMATLAQKQKQKQKARRALLVVDMINDYLAPGRPMEVPRAREIVPALAKRLGDARAEGVPVVYVVDRHAPDDADLDVWGAHAVEGSEGGEVWPALAPTPGDRVVGHPSYSGFFNSDLDATLRELKVDTIVLTGCLTELQMFATATDAMQRGYAVEVPADAQAGASEAHEQVALGMMRFMLPYEPARRELLRTVAV